MTDLETLLDVAVSGEEFPPPGPELYAAASRRRRRRLVQRVAGGVAAVAVVSGGTVVVASSTGVGLFGSHSGAVAAASGSSGASGFSTTAVTALADAPACVREDLARVNWLVRTRHTYAVVVVDIPDAPKVLMTQGLTSGYGWAQASVHAVLADLPGLTPAGTFKLWEGVSPEFNPPPGRYLMLLFLDNSPKVPGGIYGDPIWGFAATPVFPVSGDRMTVTCAGGTRVTLPWADAATTWLGPDAPASAPDTTVPPGAASTVSPT